MSWFIVFTNNVKRSLNKKATFLVTIVIPIIVVILGICANYVSMPSFNIGILDANQSEVSQNVIQTLKNADGIHVGLADRNTIHTDIITGKFSAIVDFLDEDNFILYSVKDESIQKNLKQLIDSCITNHTSIDINSLQENSLGVAQRTIAFIVLFLMITSTGTASLMIKDKISGTYTRFMYSPQKSGTYIMGNVFYNFLISYFQFFIAVSVTELFRINMGISYSNLLVMGIWVAALSTSYGTCITSMFAKEMYANLFSTFIALILSLIGGTFIAFDKMPLMLQRISIISPMRWFIDATTYLEKGNAWFSGLQYVIILTLFILAFVLISIIINNKKVTSRK